MNVERAGGIGHKFPVAVERDGFQGRRLRERPRCGAGEEKEDKGAPCESTREFSPGKPHTLFGVSTFEIRSAAIHHAQGSLFSAAQKWQEANWGVRCFGSGSV